jgi:uroporphyrin-III C-methyltransferase
VVQVVEEEGSRPPGLLVLGNACEVLWRGEEEKRRQWKWVIEEGFTGLEDFVGGGFEELVGGGEKEKRGEIVRGDSSGRELKV